MSRVLVETATFDATVTVPVNGDARTAESVAVGFQALANRTRELYANRGVAPFVRGQFHNGPGVPFAPADWAFISPFSLTSGVATATRAYFPLLLPDGGTLTDVYVLFQGGAGHGALPATKPFAQLFKQSSVTGVATQISTTTTDAPASVGAFEAFHVLGPSGGVGPTWTGLTEGISSSDRWVVRVDTEDGANAVIGDVIYGIYTLTTVSTLGG